MMQRYLQRVRNRTEKGASGDSRKDRGAAIVEFAIALPIFIALLLLIFDAGLGYSASRTSSSAARSAARIGALAGDTSSADYQVLQSLRAEFAGFGQENGGGANIIMVYMSDSTNADGLPPSSCTKANKCNLYPASILDSLTEEAFTQNRVDLPDGTKTCAATDPDYNWCPLDRRLDEGKFLGVYISSDYDTTTGLETDAFSLEDRAVFALYFPPEPVELPAE